ncbi:S-layer homology domain-containing protein [Paenibacillus glycanilyticus]|uniref:S-layer homology domain-containing protein n=1 Tax=Paenibacillus glycanilyticus TaxID=126569 RepID=UPI000FD97D21|nr:S-layer homology domain-containing protein [Paenibacillus glycanilyticus]
MKKVLAALLALCIVVLPATGYAAAAAFALNISAKEVLRGGEITFSGTAEDDVVLKIIRPNQTTFYMDVIEPTNGTYTATITIPETQDFAPWGVYNVAATSGSSTVNKTFSVVEKLGEGGTGPEEPSNPGNGNGGAGTTPPAATIPADAGDSTGSTIKPELGKDGYMFGSGTLASAISSAQGSSSITVELPAATGDAGSALNFPTETLKTLKDKNLDLIVTSGSSTLRFPAGSIGTSDTSASSQVRIVVNTVLTSDAKNAVNQALQSNPDYASTGVVLTATIQVINGSSVTEIHNLDKPAEVTFKLTDDQAKQLHSGLAGVYYVNGKQLDYVGGKLEGNTFKFNARHFSTYTILEYSKTFVDVPAGHWAEAAVKSLSAKHIVSGVDQQHYAPNRNITRSEFATMMMRAVDYTGKEADAAAANPFKDVPAGQYYTDAVTRAASLGIMSGYGGSFRPNDPITREEAVVTLVRTVKYFEVKDTGKGAPAFADMKQISAWASAAVDQAWKLGLIEGDGKQFHPKAALTRAEIAVMINRLMP